MGPLLLLSAFILTFVDPSLLLLPVSTESENYRDATDTDTEEILLGILVVPSGVDPLNCGLYYHEDQGSSPDDVVVIFVQCFTPDDLGLPPPLFLEFVPTNDTGLTAGNW